MQKTTLLTSVLTVALMACGEDINKPALLDKPRILAVRADPPQPRFGVTTTLSTLLYEPPREHVGAGRCPVPGATIHKWSWCPIGFVADSATNTFKCPFPEGGWRQLYATLGLGEATPYELGYGETMVFTNPFPAPLLYALCRGEIGSTLGEAPGSATAGKSVFGCDLPAKDIADKLDLTNPMNTHPIGFKITIKVEVTPACPDLVPAGFTPLIALYTLHLPTDDSIPVNQNPVISGIFATDNVVEVLQGGLNGGLDAGSPADGAGEGAIDGGVEPIDGGWDGGLELPDAGRGGPDGSVPLAEDPLVKVRRDKHVGLALGIDIATAEHLPVPGTIDYTSVTQTQPIALTRHYEHLSFSWYGETGDFTDDGRGHDTGYLPTSIPDTQPDVGPSDADRASFEYNTENTWDLPRNEDWGHKTARIIVVVRDGRGGVAWTSKQVSLEDKP